MKQRFQRNSVINASQNNMEYYGHSADDGVQWQLLWKHLLNVAELAQLFAKPLGLEKEAEIFKLTLETQASP